MHRKSHKKIMLIARIILIILAVGLLVVEAGFYYGQKKYGLVWISPWLKYGLYWLLGAAFFCLVLLAIKNKKVQLALATLGILASAGLAVVVATSGTTTLRAYSLSPNKKNVFYAAQSGTTLTYYQTYYWLLARPKESVADVKQLGTVVWLTDDVAALSYEKSDQTLQFYLGTYGYRGSAISYNYVTSLSRGLWQNDALTLDNTSNGVTVSTTNGLQTFAAEAVTQFGTSAVTLNENGAAQYAYAISANATYDAGASVPSNQADVTLLVVQPNLNKMTVETLQFVSAEN